MKTIIKIMIPCFAALLMISCSDTMDDKAVIDGKYWKATSATVTLSSAEAVDYQTVNATVVVTNKEELIETGVQLSTTEDFTSGVITAANDSVATEFNLDVTNVSAETGYYVRAYAVTRTAGTIVSDIQTVTTPKAPIFSLDGTYLATEYDLNDDDEWELADQYEIEFEFDADDPTIVYITNIWDGGMTVSGTYNEATGVVTVPSMQVIYPHPSYGDVWMRGVTDAIDGYTANVLFSFTALGGNMTSSVWAAQCSAGNFGFCRLTLVHL